MCKAGSQAKGIIVAVPSVVVCATVCKCMGSKSNPMTDVCNSMEKIIIFKVGDVEVSFYVC